MADNGPSQPYEPLLAGLKKLFISTKYSDFTVICGGQKFNVHKNVLCMQPSVFAAAIDGGFKESVTGTFEITGYMPRIIRAMLRFLYNFDYETDNDDETSQLLFHVRMYEIARQYNITALEALAKTKFEMLAKEEWNEIDDDVVAAAYDATSDKDPLREIIITIVHEHAKELMEKPDFKATMESVCSFGADLAESLAKDSRLPHNCQVYRCPCCCTDVLGAFANNAYYYCCYCGDRRCNWSNYVKK